MPTICLSRVHDTSFCVKYNRLTHKTKFENSRRSLAIALHRILQLKQPKSMICLVYYAIKINPFLFRSKQVVWCLLWYNVSFWRCQGGGRLAPSKFYSALPFALSIPSLTVHKYIDLAVGLIQIFNWPSQGCLKDIWGRGKNIWGLFVIII